MVNSHLQNAQLFYKKTINKNKTIQKTLQ